MIRSKRGRTLVILGTLAAITLLGAFAWLNTPSPNPREGPIRFESEQWIATPSTFSHESLRQRMVDDLLSSHLLVGRSRKDAESLLGPPDTSAYFREYDMVYSLGRERGSYMAIDSEWLVIKLDGADVVIEARLITD